jgi:putative transposase
VGHHQAARPAPGIYYDLYVILDIYSRYVPGFLVAPADTGELAAAFIAHTIAAQGAPPRVVHADRGTSMTSKPVALLLADLGVVRSHARPKPVTTAPTARPRSRRSSIARPFPTGSGLWPTQGLSAQRFSATTITPTATAASVCTHRPRRTTAPRPRSARYAPRS